jgi:ADP-heptose:LPS heptosyltransferase
MKKIWSLLKLCWIVGRETLLAGVAWLRRDGSAEDHLRTAAIALHDDLLQLLAAGQRRFGPRPGSDIDRILIVKLDRIGDMVNTTPVFDALKALFPRARLDVVGHPGPLSLLEGDDRVGERYVYRSCLYHPLPMRCPSFGDWRLIRQLRRRRYPLVVYLRGSFPFLFLGPGTCLGAAKFVPGEPVIERYLKPLEALFGPVPHTDPRLPIDATATRFAQELFATNNGRSGPHIVIHATASAAARMWPAERYAVVADRLQEEFGAKVHFLAALAEKASLERIATCANRRHTYHYALKLPQVAAVIAASDLFVGNDSGLAHVAAAVGTPVIVLWGGANLSMSRPKAPPRRCVILYHEMACRDGCPETRCVNPVPLECLMKIRADDVLEAAGRLLDRRDWFEESSSAANSDLN